MASNYDIEWRRKIKLKLIYARQLLNSELMSSQKRSKLVLRQGGRAPFMR
jgi:hypothetical protein